MRSGKNTISLLKEHLRSGEKTISLLKEHLTKTQSGKNTIPEGNA